MSRFGHRRVGLVEVEILIYKPPSSINNNFLRNFEQIIDTHRDNNIVIGDMNIDTSKNNTTSDEYNNIIVSNGYKLVNEISKKATTRKTDTSESIIDHIITSKVSYITCDINNTFRITTLL